MITRKIFTCLCFLALSLAGCVSMANACLNEIGRSTVGEKIHIDELPPDEFLKALITHEEESYWRGVLSDLKHLDGRSGRFENRNNAAVAMLHVGRVREAIRILEQLEASDPGFYYVAANLGTAYELNGENQKALEWIKKGIERNKEAHNGSEWLHVKILEAKLQLEKDPKWLSKNSVLGINLIPAEQLQANGPTVTDHLGETRNLKQIQDALVYQLHERLEFIKPPEGVVANLLFDLARTLASTRGHEHSDKVAAFAQTYGADLMPWSSSGPFLPAAELPPPVSTAPYWIVGGVVFGLAWLAIVVLAMRARKARRSS